MSNIDDFGKDFRQTGTVYLEQTVYTSHKQYKGEIKYFTNFVRVRTNHKGTFDIPYSSIHIIKIDENPSLERF
jgi:hypothetical protein